MRRWHANNGRGMATITKAVENGARRVASPAGSRGRHRRGILLRRRAGPLSLISFAIHDIDITAARHARRVAVSFVAKNTGFGSQPTKGCPQLAPRSSHCSDGL